MSSKSVSWQVWMADLFATADAEQTGRRPVVVASSPFFVSFPTATAVVVPLTTRDLGLPHHVPINSVQAGLSRPSWARTDDIRTISEQHLIGRPLGTVSDKEAADIRAYLRLMLDI